MRKSANNDANCSFVFGMFPISSTSSSWEQEATLEECETAKLLLLMRGVRVEFTGNPPAYSISNRDRELYVVRAPRVVPNEMHQDHSFYDPAIAAQH
ncbi:hypothetical protein WAI453_003499 [Rhynchosporium graminicola]